MQTYEGQCHCGAIAFTFESEPITMGVRCNCSLCRRRGAIMSTAYIDPAHFHPKRSFEKDLQRYQFGDHSVHHYFCKHCGIYPFHDAVTRPGHYRINLGCVAKLDVFALPIKTIDGASF